MNYRYFATQETLADVQQGNFGSMAMARLNRYLLSDRPNSGNNVRPIIDNLVENTPTTKGGIRFFWLIIEKDNLTLYVLRKMFRHNSAYDCLKFYTKEQKEQMLRDFALGDDEMVQVRKFISSLATSASSCAVVVPKPNLSVSEHRFITSPLNINHKIFDVPVFEHKPWVKFVKTASDSFLDEFCKKFRDYVERNYVERQDGFKWNVIHVGNTTIDVYQKNGDSFIYTKRDGKEDVRTEEEPKPEYARCYPHKFLESPIRWAKMEKDPKSNLCLTDEQMGIVSSVGNLKYPLFLTGRAGSGKSTMLQYLFAEVILRYISVKKDSKEDLLPPVYLSYSRELVKSARNNLSSLFENTSLYNDVIEENGADYKTDIEPYLYVPEKRGELKDGMMLYTFRDLVRICARRFNEQILRERFTKNRHWDYSDFEVEWQKRFGRNQEALRDYSPSLSWYIIRTYIKGWDSEKYLTCENYMSKELDGRRTVTESTYRKVYNKVWEGWYMKETTSDGNEIPVHWDDQDLIRWCIQSDSLDEICSALFCDEAQDFTRIELEFLLNVSSLSNRTISNAEEIQKFPFVFVGDEYQTLNPTGFSWESLRECFWAYLTEKTGCKNIDMKKVEPLKQNHRSLSPIVHFANLIQLLRATRFGDEQEPQDFHYEGIEDVICCPSNARNWDAMAKGKLTLVLPLSSENDDRKETVLKDYPELKDFYHEDILFLTPSEAKGNEYPHVALYGFTDKSGLLNIDELLHWFEKGNKPTKPANEADIPLKFSLSNAYVAATRAEQRLYIIEIPREQSLWAFTFDASGCEDDNEKVKLGLKAEKLKDIMLRCTDNPKLWEHKIGHMSYGEFPDFGEGNTDFYKSETNLAELEGSALSRYQFNKIARYYRNMGNHEDEHRCYAKGYEKECKYVDAAKEYLKAQMPDEAIECYWLAMSSSLVSTKEAVAIFATITGCKSQTNKLLAEIAGFATKSSVMVSSAIVELNKVLAILSNDIDKDDLQLWSDILNYFLCNLKITGKSVDLFAEIKTCHDSLLAKGVQLDSSLLASKAYESKAYAVAVALWEESTPSIYPAEYYKAKVTLVNFPEKLLFMEGTQDPSWSHSAVEEFRNHGLDYKLLYNFKYRSVLFSAISKDATAMKENFDTLPYRFAFSDSYDSAKSLLIPYLSHKGFTEINTECIAALIKVQYRMLADWGKSENQYLRYDVIHFLEAVEFMKRLQTEGLEYIEISLKEVNYKLIDFCQNHKKYLRTPLGYAIFVEMGKLMGERGKYSDAMRYYEHAAKLIDNDQHQRKMQIARLLYMEKYADTQKDFSEQSKTRRDAETLRIELSIKDEPDIPVMQPEDWVSVYASACKFDSKMKGENTNSESVTTAVSQLNETFEKIEGKDTKSANNTSTDGSIDTFKFSYDRYNLVFRQHKGEIELRDDEEELCGKLSNGKFANDDDFIINEGRVLYKETGNATPFVIKIKNKTMTFQIIQEE